MTGSTVSTLHGLQYKLPLHDARVAYTGYRQTVYNEKLPITAHREKVGSN